MEADFRGCAYFSWLDSIIGVSRLTTASTQALTEHFNNAEFLPAAQRHGHSEGGMVGFKGHFGPVGLHWGLPASGVRFLKF